MTGDLPGGTFFAIALTRDAATTARLLAETLPRTRAFAPARFSGEEPGECGECGGEAFWDEIPESVIRLAVLKAASLKK